MIRAGLGFGALGFLAGGLLGPLRELVLAPRLGGMAAALLEAAVMAVLLWLAARATVPRHADARGRAVIAVIALLVGVLAEFALAWVFVVTGLAVGRAPRSLAEQAPGVVLLFWLVALPFLVRR